MYRIAVIGKIPLSCMSELCSIERATEIVGSLIAKQGFIALPIRRANQCVIVPIGTRNKKLQVGSVTIHPHISAKTLDSAESELKAAVIDACHALVTEGANAVDVKQS